MGTEAALLRCRALCIGYQGRPILPEIDLTIRRGELWAVIGRNGSGKTTWLRTLLGLSPPLSGAVEHVQPRLRLSYLPQRQAFDELYPLLARDIVSMGPERGNSIFGPRRPGTRELVSRALAAVQASDLADRPFRQLSEGQKQRVLFARITAAEPDLAVLDEPTSAMDRVAEREAYELLVRLQRESGMAIVVVSHFLGLAQDFADRALLLDPDTPAVLAGPANEVLGHEVFRQRYGASAERGL